LRLGAYTLFISLAIASCLQKGHYRKRIDLPARIPLTLWTGVPSDDMKTDELSDREGEGDSDRVADDDEEEDEGEADDGS